MADSAPQKRAAALIPLSHDHHHALARAREAVLALDGKGMDGKAGEIDLAALAARLAAFCEGELAQHFAREEDHLLPALRRATGDAPLAAETERQHERLRALGAALAHGREPLEKRLADWAKALADHVRFEERELFPAAQAALDAGELAELGRRLEGSGPACGI